MQRNTENLKMLHQFEAWGFLLSSTILERDISLNDLRMFPFDSIKIDRSFVMHLLTNADCVAIASRVAGLGRDFHVDTIAEGVETEDQLMLMRASGRTRAERLLKKQAVSGMTAASILRRNLRLNVDQ